MQRRDQIKLGIHYAGCVGISVVEATHHIYFFNWQFYVIFLAYTGLMKVTVLRNLFAKPEEIDFTNSLTP